MTKMYKDIVRCNLAIQDKTTTEEKRTAAIEGLKFYFKHLIDNTDGKYAQGAQNPYVSISQRINGKEAIIRSALMGKRTDFSARTVLSPDPTLRIGEMRIPEDMAPYLTVHVYVNSYNIEKMTRLFKAGKVTHIIPREGRRSGNRIRVDENLIATITPQIGDQLDRHLMDNDPVPAIFNRQPTLHRYSMMGYKTKLGKQKTIGLHPGVCKAHNADFDGDEGNIHMVQELEAACEAASFMNVINNIMTAQSNKNIIGVILDGVVGSYIMTHFNAIFDVDEYDEFINSITNKDSFDTLERRLIDRNIPKMSGRGVFSALFPGGFEYKKSVNDNIVEIKDGILINGDITSDHVGTTHGSMIQVMIKDFGVNRTVDFISDIYFLMNKFMARYPLTVGLADCILPYSEDIDPQTEIQNYIQEAKLSIKAMGGKMENPLDEERREKTIQSKLNTAATLGAKISKKLLPEWNSFNLMIASGSKGSFYNLAQIVAVLGQQFQLGKRMPEALSNGTRALPYFEMNDLDPEARGFVVNSFLHGLTPPQLFFHQMGGRVGLMDTANKTSETGYIHHRMVKALEDIKVNEDGSVRSASGSIFEYTYGDDGFDASMLENIKTKYGSYASFINIERTVNRLNTKYGYPSTPLSTQNPSALVLFQVGQVYNVDGHEATIITIESRAISKDKRDELIQVRYNDTDEIVWKLPNEIGPLIPNPSKYVNMYSVNDRSAIIIGTTITSFDVQYDDKSIQRLNFTYSVVPGGHYVIFGRNCIVLKVYYDYQIRYLDNNEESSIPIDEIGEPIGKTQVL